MRSSDATEIVSQFPSNVRNVSHSVVATELQQEFLASLENPIAFPKESALGRFIFPGCILHYLWARFRALYYYSQIVTTTGGIYIITDG